jgi:hypothetical protein
MANSYASTAELQRANTAVVEVANVFDRGNVRVHVVGPYLVFGMHIREYDGYDWNGYSAFNVLKGPGGEWLSDYPSTSGYPWEPQYMMANDLAAIRDEIERKHIRNGAKKVEISALEYAQSDAGAWIQDLAESYGADSKGLFW